MSAIAEILGILVDALLGSRCGRCLERHHNLALHEYLDHGDAMPAEPSRFSV